MTVMSNPTQKKINHEAQVMCGHIIRPNPCTENLCQLGPSIQGTGHVLLPKTIIIPDTKRTKSQTEMDFGLFINSEFLRK